MNRIVLEHYPASKLPDEMRGDVDPAATVTVVVTVEGQLPDSILSLNDIFALSGFRRRSMVEINEDLQVQRDEWE